MNSMTDVRKSEADKKAIIFYIFLALIPFFSELARLITENLNPEGIAEEIMTEIEAATGTICLIPAYIFVAPLGLLFTLIPLLFIKIARAVFIDDKRYSYAAIGAVFCYNIFVKDFIADIRYITGSTLHITENNHVYIEHITDIVALIIAPVFICFLFFLSRIIIRPDTGKKHISKHIFLGITITAAPAFLLFSINTISTVTEILYHESILSFFASEMIYRVLLAFIPVLFAFWVLFMSAAVFRDFRAGLIAVACYSIPYTIAASLMGITSDLVRSLIDSYKAISIVQAVLSLILILSAILAAFLYYLLKILLPYIKMRKKALANEIPSDISEGLSEACNSKYNYFNEQNTV